MAPCPEEVDVFTEPHARIRTLVTSYSTRLENTNFESLVDMEVLLHELCNAFVQFKEHERIENEYILKRLKAKLKALRIRNKLVCKCHSDSQLSDMIRLFERGLDDVVHQPSFERLHYGRSLREALTDFNERFLPHMQEEEEVFQPLLIQYFSYEELKELKMKVISEHVARTKEAYEKCDRMKPETMQPLLTSSAGSSTHIHSLPSEVLVGIFSFLNAKDLSSCAQVCTLWSDLAMDSSLWANVCPIAWFMGFWDVRVAEAKSIGISSVEEASLLRQSTSYNGIEDEQEELRCYRDEDADIDEAQYDSDDSDCTGSALPTMIQERNRLSAMALHVFPRVGAGVKNLILAGSTGLTSSLLRKIISCCPNLETLDLSLTAIDDSAFKNLPLSGLTKSLKSLSLAGCSEITDAALLAFVEPNPCCRRDRTLTSDATTRHAATAVAAGCARSCPFAPGCPLFATQCDRACSDNFRSSPFRTSPTFARQQGGCAVAAAAAALSAFGVDSVVLGLEDLQLPCVAGSVGQYKARIVKNKNGCQQSATSRQCHGSGKGSSGGGMPVLEHLDLSGCCRITDASLRCLLPAPRLAELNLSGCFNLTGVGISRFIERCERLDPSLLYYCDNIVDGPFPNSAGGCCNLGSTVYACCRSGL